MGKFQGLILLAGLVVVVLCTYNFFVFGVIQPFPLTWNHSADELRLVELERDRQALSSKLGAGQRVTSMAGVPQVGAPDASETAAIARLDAEIAALRIRIASAPR
jgi:hypothetical protein